MKTLTVRLPEMLYAELEAESRARNTSKSDVVRERLATYHVAPPGKRPLTIAEACPDLFRRLEEDAKKVAHLPKRNISENVKKLLPGIIRAKKLHR